MSTRACTDRGGRGCPCPWHARMRVYGREYAAKQRRQELDARRMSASTCPRRFGKYGICGAVLESDVIDGCLVVACPACARFARGICHDCPRPVAGRRGHARRCAEHRTLALRASYRKHDANNKRERRAGNRRRYHADEARRQEKLEYKRAWRKANPDKVRAQKERATARHPERMIEYQAAYRAAHRRKIRNRERKRWHGIVKQRTCLTRGCSIVVTGRKKKCRRCLERERLAALAALAPHRGRGHRTDLERAS